MKMNIKAYTMHSLQDNTLVASFFSPVLHCLKDTRNAFGFTMNMLKYLHLLQNKSYSHQYLHVKTKQNQETDL